jgi:hypothetical protein
MPRKPIDPLIKYESLPDTNDVVDALFDYLLKKLFDEQDE